MRVRIEALGLGSAGSGNFRRRKFFEKRHVVSPVDDAYEMMRSKKGAWD
jgi:hypothetical protein